MALSRLTRAKEVVDSIRDVKNVSQEGKMLIRQQEIINSLEEKVKSLEQKVEQLSQKSSDPQPFLDKLLFKAVNENNFVRMNLVLQLGANVHAVNRENETILCMVSKKNDKDAIEALLDNLPKDDGTAQLILTTLEIFSEQNNRDLDEIKRFLANVLLLQAAKQGKILWVLKAFEYGANKDAQDKFFETALHKACYAERAEIVNFLLKQHCSIAKKDVNRQTPAEVTNNPSIKSLISHYQHASATIIQTKFRGFFAKNKYKEQVQKLSEASFANLAKAGKYTQIKELANALSEKRFHDALRMMREQSQKEVKTRLSI